MIVKVDSHSQTTPHINDQSDDIEDAAPVLVSHDARLCPLTLSHLPHLPQVLFLAGGADTPHIQPRM